MDRARLKHNSDLRVVQAIDIKPNRHYRRAVRKQDSADKVSMPQSQTVSPHRTQENFRTKNVASTDTYNFRQSVATDIKEDVASTFQVVSGGKGTEKALPLSPQTHARHASCNSGDFSPIRGPAAIIHHNGKDLETHQLLSPPRIPKSRSRSNVSKGVDCSINDRPISNYSQRSNAVDVMLRQQVGITAAEQRKEIRSRKLATTQKVLKPKVFKMVMPTIPLNSEESIYNQTPIARKIGVAETLTAMDMNKQNEYVIIAGQKLVQLVENSQQLMKADGGTQTKDSLEMSYEEPTSPLRAPSAVTADELFNFNVSQKLRATLSKRSQLLNITNNNMPTMMDKSNQFQVLENVRQEKMPSSMQSSYTPHYSHLKPNNDGGKSPTASSRTRTPIYHNVKNTAGRKQGLRPTSQMSVPLSAINSVESSHYSKDLMQSKQLASMLLSDGGFNTARDGNNTITSESRESHQHRKDIIQNRSKDRVIASNELFVNSQDPPIRLVSGRSEISPGGALHSENEENDASDNMEKSHRDDTTTEMMDRNYHLGSPLLPPSTLTSMLNNPPHDGKQTPVSSASMVYGAPTLGQQTRKTDYSAISIIGGASKKLKKGGVCTNESYRESVVTKKISDIRDGKVTERDSVTLTISTGVQYEQASPPIQASVIKTPPESGTVHLKCSRSPTVIGDPVLTRVVAGRAQQSISPRTSNPPIIKTNDKNFKTIVTRNFNDQVLTRAVEGCSDTLLNSNESLKASITFPLQQQQQEFGRTTTNNFHVPHQKLHGQEIQSGKKLKMAKITGALRKSQNTKRYSAMQQEIQLQQQAVLNTYSVEYAPDSSQMSKGNPISAVQQNDSVMSRVSENYIQATVDGGLTIGQNMQQQSIDLRNSLKVDLKHFQMVGMIDADTDLNTSVGHSHRSKASIIKEIDKVTRFTAADITASIHVPQMQHTKNSGSRKPQLLNICFQDGKKENTMDRMVDAQDFKLETVMSNSSRSRTSSTPYQTKRGGIPEHLRLKFTSSKSRQRHGQMASTLNDSQKSNTKRGGQAAATRLEVSISTAAPVQETNEEEIEKANANQQAQWGKLFEKLSTKKVVRNITATKQTGLLNPITTPKLNNRTYIKRDSHQIGTIADVSKTQESRCSDLPQDRPDQPLVWKTAKTTPVRTRVFSGEGQLTGEDQQLQQQQLPSYERQKTALKFTKTANFTPSKIASTLSANSSNHSIGEGVPEVFHNHSFNSVKKSHTITNSNRMGMNHAKTTVKDYPEGVSRPSKRQQSMGVEKQQVSDLTVGEVKAMQQTVTNDYIRMQQFDSVRPTTTPQMHQSKTLHGSDISPYHTSNKLESRRKHPIRTPTPNQMSRDLQQHSQIYEMLKAEVKIQPNITITDQQRNSSQITVIPIQDPRYPHDTVSSTEYGRSVQSVITIKRAATTQQVGARRPNYNKLDQRAFRLRQNVSHGRPGIQLACSGPSETLSPAVFSYTAPSSDIASSNSRSIMPLVKENSGFYTTLASKKPALQTTKVLMSKELALKKPRKIPLNKYGAFAEYQKTYPTPLGKKIQYVEDQKQKLRQFEQNILLMKPRQIRSRHPADLQEKNSRLYGVTQQTQESGQQGIH